MNEEIMVYILTQAMDIKRMKFCHLQNMDGPWGPYAKWNKSDREDKCYEHL